MAADQFQEVGQAAINLAQVTDSSVEDATSKILEMMKSPAKGAREFDSALHFLTTSQMQEIAHLDNMGDHTAAATKLLDALSASVESTAKQIKQSMPWYDRLIDLEKRSFSNLFSSLGNALIPASQKSPIQQYLDAKRAYQKTIDEYKRDQALVQGGDLPAGALGPDRARVDRAYQYAISLYHKYNIAQVQSDNAIKGV